MKILGIDLGSREVKIVILDTRGEIHFRHSMSTMRFYKDCCSYEGEIRVNLESLGLGSEDFDFGVSTGYGRNNTELIGFKAKKRVDGVI